MRPSVKFAVIQRHRESYSVSIMCKFVGASRSGYYDFAKRYGQPDLVAIPLDPPMTTEVSLVWRKARRMPDDIKYLIGFMKDAINRAGDII